MRRIVCTGCKERYHREMHPEDVATGWQRRVVPLRVKKPQDHIIVVNGEREELANIMCDDCGKVINDGTAALAITMWRGSEIESWEQEYGEPIT